jgi:hypothetical protein
MARPSKLESWAFAAAFVAAWWLSTAAALSY